MLSFKFMFTRTKSNLVRTDSPLLISHFTIKEVELYYNLYEEKNQFDTFRVYILNVYKCSREVFAFLRMYLFLFYISRKLLLQLNTKKSKKEIFLVSLTIILA